MLILLPTPTVVYGPLGWLHKHLPQFQPFWFLMYCNWKQFVRSSLITKDALAIFITLKQFPSYDIRGNDILYTFESCYTKLFSPECLLLTKMSCLTKFLKKQLLNHAMLLRTTRKKLKDEKVVIPILGSALASGNVYNMLILISIDGESGGKSLRHVLVASSQHSLATSSSQTYIKFQWFLSTITKKSSKTSS